MSTIYTLHCVVLASKYKISSNSVVDRTNIIYQRIFNCFSSSFEFHSHFHFIDKNGSVVRIMKNRKPYQRQMTTDAVKIQNKQLRDKRKSDSESLSKNYLILSFSMSIFASLTLPHTGVRICNQMTHIVLRFPFIIYLLGPCATSVQLNPMIT